MGYPFEHWIGVDFDGTLAEYHEWQGPDHFGPPIFPMIYRVRAWLAQGKRVHIVTARVASNQDPDVRECAYEAIGLWCIRYLGQVLSIQAEKDPGMLELWDDSVVRVGHNTGEISPCLLFVGLPGTVDADLGCTVSEALPLILSGRFTTVIITNRAWGDKTAVENLHTELLQAAQEGRLARISIWSSSEFMVNISRVWDEQEAQYLKEVAE